MQLAISTSCQCQGRVGPEIRVLELTSLGKAKACFHHFFSEDLNCISGWVHCMIAKFQELQDMTQGSAGGMIKYCVTHGKISIFLFLG